MAKIHKTQEQQIEKHQFEQKNTVSQQSVTDWQEPDPGFTLIFAKQQMLFNSDATGSHGDAWSWSPSYWKNCVY